MSNTNQEQQEEGRFGAPLSQSEADALARKWSEGFIESAPDEIRRAIERHEEAPLAESYGIIELADLYPGYTQAMDYMIDKGLTQLVADVDPAIVEQNAVEDECSRQVAEKARNGRWDQHELEQAYRLCLSSSSASQPPFIPPDPNTLEESTPALAERAPLTVSLPSSPAPKSSRPGSRE